MRGRDCIYCVTASSTGESRCYEPAHTTYERDEDGHTRPVASACDSDGPACTGAVPRHGQHAHE
jgi:hypothetical protein